MEDDQLIKARGANNSHINVSPSHSTTPTTFRPGGRDLYPDELPICFHDYNYTPTPAVIASVCMVFGLLYCFLGYRLLKATMFVTGLLLGGVITYVVCLQEELLPLTGRLGVTALVGILVGLITMLAQQVGLFLTGFCGGALLGSLGLVITEWFTSPPSVWICIGTIFLPGFLFALLILRFQRPVTILGTSLMGGGLVAGGLDYFVEGWTAVRWMGDRVTLTPSGRLCWWTWGVLAVWPSLATLGIIAQHNITARHTKQVVNVRKRGKKVKLQKQRERDAKNETSRPLAKAEHTSVELDRTGTGDRPQNRYLHLYQVRRVNGDVISQSYIQSIQHKLSTAVRKKVVAMPPTRPPAQPSVECDPMQASIIEYRQPPNS